MPEAVLRWKTTHDISQVDDVLGALVDSYERDFAKHGGARQFAKISQVWQSLPSQLAHNLRALGRANTRMRSCGWRARDLSTG